MRGLAIKKKLFKSTEGSRISLFSSGLRPKRTLRLVLWTAEEQGGVGAFHYYQSHKVRAARLLGFSHGIQRRQQFPLLSWRIVKCTPHVTTECSCYPEVSLSDQPVDPPQVTITLTFITTDWFRLFLNFI